MPTSKDFLSFCVFIGFGGLQSVLAQTPQYPYALFDLGTHGSCPAQSSYGFALNEWGQVAAQMCSEPSDGAIYFNGSLTILDRLTDLTNAAHDINDAGIAIGSSFFNSSFPFITHATVWQVNGQVTDLGTFGGSYSFADGINERGEIVGASTDANEVEHPVMWRDGQIIDLGLLPGALGRTWALDINESSQVVGYTTIGGRSKAFIWDNEVLSALPLGIGGESCAAYCINDFGLVGGFTDDFTNLLGYPCIWHLPDLTITNLITGSGFKSGTTQSLNNAGTAVGHGFLQGNSGFFPNAWVSDWDGPMVALDTMLPPHHYWQLEWAYDVNDAGQITGVGVNKRERTERGYLLTPVHPTLTLTQPSPGKAGQRNTLTLTGAAPGARIYFVYGTTGGGAVVPGCDLQEAAIQIDSPKVIGIAIADAFGVATLSANVPLSARNAGDILIQAVDPQRCVQSQLVVEVFE